MADWRQAGYGWNGGYRRDGQRRGGWHGSRTAGEGSVRHQLADRLLNPIRKRFECGRPPRRDRRVKTAGARGARDARDARDRDGQAIVRAIEWGQ